MPPGQGEEAPTEVTGGPVRRFTVKSVVRSVFGVPLLLLPLLLLAVHCFLAVFRIQNETGRETGEA